MTAWKVVEPEDEEEERVLTCRECFNDYPYSEYDDGFCSDYCMHRYEKELMGLDDDEEDE